MAYPTYSIATDTAAGALDRDVLDAEIRADPGAPGDYTGLSTAGDVLTLHCTTEPTAGEQTTLDGLVAAHDPTPTLDEYKAAKMGLCDMECGRRFGLGFTHASKTYSLSFAAQINHLGGQDRKTAWTTDGRFPVLVSTIDNTDAISLADEAALDAFYGDAADQSVVLHQDCQTVKDAIRDAVDEAAVDTAAASYLAGGAP